MSRRSSRTAYHHYPEAVRSALEALRPVLESRQPSRFRLLRVVCPNQHRLLDIYATKLGPVYWHEMAAAAAPEGARVPAYRQREMYLAGRVSEGPPEPLPASCRCRTAAIPCEWLGESLQNLDAAGLRLGSPKRRVVWSRGAPLLA